MKFSLPVLALALTSALAAQTVETFPNTLPTSYTGNSWPFNNTAATFRTQFIYDGSMINNPGPVLIQRLRFRRSSLTATTTGLLTNVTCSLSTSPVTWSTVSATFANNVGKDVTQIFKGDLKVNSSAWYVDITLPTPFLFDPKNTLCFDFERGAATGTNVYPGSGGYASGGSNGTPSPFMANRVWGTPGQATGSLDSAATQANGYANACEVTWIPAAGLYSNFSATPSSGKSPLLVQFTDKTYTSDPGGVTSWKWDFNNDNVVDATVQNPKFAFVGVGYGKTFTVSLETTDSTHSPSKITKKDFILVNPFPQGTATNFGAGSTNKPTNGPIDPGPFNRTYSSSSGTRGFYFQAPTTMVVTGFDVPNEANQPQQAINFFTMPSMPPAYSASYQLTAADIKFFGQALTAGTIQKPVAPIVIQKDTWVGVLGACMSTGSTMMYNSYGTAGGVNSTVLGQPVKLQRLLYQGTLAGRMDGLVPISTENAFEIARVNIYVVGNSTVPTMDTIGTPSFGSTPQWDLQGRLPGLQVGVILVSPLRLPTQIPTPFGNLLIVPNFILQVPVPGGTGQVGLPIPQDPSLADIRLQSQAVVFDITNGLYGMTNGVEWLIGQ